MRKYNDNDIIRDEAGNIDWKANGWPVPNPYYIGDTTDMPLDYFEQWMTECIKSQEDAKINPKMAMHEALMDIREILAPLIYICKRNGMNQGEYDKITKNLADLNDHLGYLKKIISEENY